VSVSKDAYDTRSTRLRTEESDMQATFNLTRVPAISIEAGNEQVVVGENLRVEITDEYDRPVEGATVLVGGEAAGETDADGVARVPIDTEGEVQVSAEYEDLTADAVTVTGVSGSTDDGGDDDDGGTGDGSPGFGVVAALLGALAAVGALARRR
jgi:PGF-CTERM protein